MQQPFRIENLKITDLSSDGHGIGRHENRVIFVEQGLPGDEVHVEVYRTRKKLSYGRIVRLVTASPFRIKPVCRHFDFCGGCRLQHFDYQAQVQLKQKQVKDALERIGNLHDYEMLPVLAAEETLYYRNRLDFGISNRRWLTADEIQSGVLFEEGAAGFHLPRVFDKVIDIHECHLMPELNNRIRLAVKQFARQHQFSFYDYRKHTGFLRGLIIRNSNLNEWMVIVTFGEEQEANRKMLLDYISAEFPQITSLQYVINTKKNESLHDLSVICYRGSPALMASLNGLKFKISPKSFFQTNSVQAETLYRVTLEFASLTGHETVYDLYSGTGTISCCAARQAGKVLGFEYVHEAIRDAGENAVLNGITNAHFFSGDIKEMLNRSFFEKHGAPDVIITDPPRAGMHGEIVRAINESGARRVVYVSCNPATQARDMALMKPYYRLVKCRPVDMFPQTLHIENVALLEKRQAG